MSELTKEAAAFIKEAKKQGVKTSEQLALERFIGRELEDWEAIYFKDGKPAVGFKPGVPYYTLQCSVCGNRAFTVADSTSQPNLDQSEAAG